MMVIASFGEGENSDNYHISSMYNRTISIEILKKGTLAVEVHLSGSLTCHFLKQQLGTLTWKSEFLRNEVYSRCSGSVLSKDGRI